MGGCASRPKEFDNKPEDSAPAEAPASPKKAEAEAETVGQVFILLRTYYL